MDMSSVVLPDLTQATYKSHPFHRDAETWSETNCYIDLWIEVLHSLQLDPFALLPFSFAADFEGDQWTFLKPSLDDLWSLYGIDVQELNIWESLDQHIAVQVGRGHLPLIEVDAFFLPETQGASYQIEHTKTTIGINRIDLTNEQLGYFHNGGYYELQGTDFRNVLRIGSPAGQETLAPYAEFAKIKNRVSLPSKRLRSISLSIAQRHLRRCPAVNPFAQYRMAFANDLEEIINRPAAYYHKYAFANLRQLGTGFLLAALYLTWLEEQEALGVEEAITAFHNISDSAKTLLFKMARTVNNKKPLAYEALMDTMEANWQTAFSLLRTRLGN
jgi:hypothetical protein